MQLFTFVANIQKCCILEEKRGSDFVEESRFLGLLSNAFLHWINVLRLALSSKVIS